MYEFIVTIYCSKADKTFIRRSFASSLGVKEKILATPEILHLTPDCNGCCTVQEITVDGDPNSTPAKTLMSWITINQGIGNL